MKLSIDREEYERVKEQALIIDVRDELEYQTLPKLPDSVNIPYEKLVTEHKKYLKNKSQLIITYCNFGNRSGKAAQFLQKEGYQAFVLRGGIQTNPALTR